MTRYKQTHKGRIPFTAEEEARWDAEAQAWADGADDRLAAEYRETRNELLSQSDWTQMNDSPLSEEVKSSWATYRTSLRDLPAHENWPNLSDSDWPIKP